MVNDRIGTRYMILNAMVQCTKTYTYKKENDSTKINTYKKRSAEKIKIYKSYNANGSTISSIL